jgi:hypothetical protein
VSTILSEEYGGPCLFDRTKSGLRLRPIMFFSRTELYYHSYLGKAETGLWAIGKLQHCIWGSPFTWITPCGGLERFFDGKYPLSRMPLRWRMQLLGYDFTTFHRPGQILPECEPILRYNVRAER